MAASHMTGASVLSGSSKSPRAASHLTGAGYSANGSAISHHRGPGSHTVHLTGMSRILYPEGPGGGGGGSVAGSAPLTMMPTGLTARTVPVSASAMAGATSVRADNTGMPPAMSPHPTGASARAPTIMSAHPTIPPQPSGMTAPFPGGFKTSVAGHNTGAFSEFNFQNLPAPTHFGADDDIAASEAGGSRAGASAGPGPGPGSVAGDASFVGAPTRLGSPMPGVPVPEDAASVAAASVGSAPIPVYGLPPGQPMSKTMQYASGLPMKELIPAIPTGGTLGDLPIHESKGAALVDAQRAFFGTHRPVQQRILWTLSKDHDPRVEGLMDWITKMQWALAKHGVRRFLDTRKRGALVVNAGYISPYHPSQPVFDWMTFDRAQVTGDRILQESIATYDPATTTVVFVFLVSDSYASAAMWRRLLTLPPSIQLSLSIPIESVKAELKKKTHVIHVKSSALARPALTPPSSSPPSPRTPPQTIVKEIIRETVKVVPEEKPKEPEEPPKKKKKKLKWWQVWKRLKRAFGSSS